MSIQYQTIHDLLYQQHPEGDWDGSVVAGDLPAGLEGRFLLNGPSRFRPPPEGDRHWLDGDGMVRVVEIKDGRVFYRRRYVGTRKWQAEKDGRAVFDRFGTLVPEGLRRRGIALESPANVSVWPLGRDLLAFGEQSPPFRLDGRSLETLEECDFNGALLDITPLSAHPKWDSHSRRLCSFGVKYRRQAATLDYYEFDESYSRLGRAGVPLAHHHSVHDFVLTDNYACFHLSPYTLDLEAFMRAEHPLADCLRWDANGITELLVMPRNGKVSFKVELPECRYCLHTIGGRENVDRPELVVEVLSANRGYYSEYKPLDRLFSNIGATQFDRFVIDLQTRNLVVGESFDLGMHVDFPTTMEGDHNMVWALGMNVEPKQEPKFYTRIVRIERSSGEIVDSWECPGSNIVAGDPGIFVDMHNSGSYWAMCQHFDTRTGQSSYVIFDAMNLDAGPVCQVELPVSDPLAFHTITLGENVESPSREWTAGT